MSPLLRLVFLTYAAVVSCEKYRLHLNVTDAEYDSLPKVFLLDDFDDCRRIKNATLYCYTNIQLSAKDELVPSTHWKILKELISMPRLFRHDRLRHGVCLPISCPNVASNDYSVGNGSLSLQRGIADCYNDKYAELGLVAEVTGMHCQSKEPVYDVDVCDIVFLFVVVTLLILIIAGTIYEYYTNRFTKIDMNSNNCTKVLTSFSLIKNWQQLTKESTTELEDALLPLQAIRVINIYLVVLIHTIFIGALIPVHNTRFYEEVSPGKNVLTNLGIVCQTFFIMTGWMLSYKMCESHVGKTVDFKHLLSKFIDRYVRLAPALLFTLLFVISWLRHMGEGPVWQKSVGVECDNCRANGIWNMFFLNNFINSYSMCMLQTWYIAADMQLYVVGLVTMMLVINYPQHSKKVFLSLICLGVLSTTIEHYYKEFDAIVRHYPENVHYLYENDKFFNDIYTATHNQLSCFVVGLACGYYFYKYKSEKKTIVITKFWYTIVLIYVWAGPAFTLIITQYFHQEGYEGASLLSTLYQSTSRLSFGLPISICLFGFAFGFGGPILSFTRWSPFRTLGRLSYTVYLWHIYPMRISLGLQRTPNYVSNYLLISKSIGDFAIVFLPALVVSLCVELPFISLKNSFKKTKEQKIEPTKKTE